MSAWSDRIASLELSDQSAPLAARCFAEVADRHAALVGVEIASRAWWVPGRIEVLGKHTDYGGGRSLLCAVERGFHVVASPRDDGAIRIIDASTNASLQIPFDRDAESKPGHWSDYPISVVRRIGRDFPLARTGVNIVMRSSLPSAAGLSSSSAMVIACFLPLAAFNNLRAMQEWSAIADEDALAGYLGAMENGRTFGPFAADRGVGTHGGSEDQTAIIRSQPGHLQQYHFLPVTHERTVAIPAGWQFVVGVSGVHAAKGGAVQARYNALAAQVAALLALWNRRSGRRDASLFAAMQSGADAVARLSAMIAADPSLDPDLSGRLGQFVDECDRIIPEVSRLLGASDVLAIGELVAQSQGNAERALRNQIPETIHLARRARELGATAASAFGAGFGGSVWALVRREDVTGFIERWREDYVTRFPARRHRADFFATNPGPAAQEIGVTAR